ncbi:DUF1643 domain-containing protein [Shewanella baltica]|uniref:DUF1643 domain-containing protein n=1 Tax=Shewanella baltica TaxID=62322 RepID=UPI00217E1B1A|nr:DUF1643 domain-containing protein [Shewanella baltica]MCS6126907.1 DUF1643 domain-containing protein [Shewanella baltica]MCS6138980.1 DUF1643 domain-containing protein [Shewanella baltica]MCS6145169.1 DUF1643 domain-containing protein [Shewanella baltica]MCS6169699.1 DUF1643 domain-containing protein [Shewanella baltica]MCS6186923.1 DUF1643 domain-containing protein [Shewanella baltica]
MNLFSELEYPQLNSHAVLSPCRRYRYALSRVWDTNKPFVLFIGLNPSTADELQDDPTIRRCIGFAKSWGYGGLVMANLFAYRATDPYEMMEVSKPVGDMNDQWLETLAEAAGVIVAAWGNHGAFINRSLEVRRLLPDLCYLKLNASGEPAHPLYLKSSLIPVPWVYGLDIEI